MHRRSIKILFAALTGFLALVYVLQNFANLDAAYQSIMYVMSGADHTAYANTLFFKSTNSLLGWSAVVLVCAGELIAALLLLFGALQMWQNISASSEDFEQSLKYAEIGAATGVLVWLGFFGVLGGAFFQMWQTPIGDGSMRGAFQFFVTCAITLLYLNVANSE